MEDKNTNQNEEKELDQSSLPTNSVPENPDTTINNSVAHVADAVNDGTDVASESGETRDDPDTRDNIDEKKETVDDTKVSGEATDATAESAEKHDFTPFTLAMSSCFRDAKNKSFPFIKTITNIDDLAKVAAYDYVSAVYGDELNNRLKRVKGYVSPKSFIQSDVVVAYVGNTQPDPTKPDLDPAEYVTPQDIIARHPDVEVNIVYDEFNMKDKDGESARPRFWVLYPITEITSRDKAQEITKAIQEINPSYDPSIDVTSVIFGTDDPLVEHHHGRMTIDAYIASTPTLPDSIPVGERHSVLTDYARKVLYRLGDTDDARTMIFKAAQHCVEALDDFDLSSLYEESKKYFHENIEGNPDFVFSNGTPPTNGNNPPVAGSDPAPKSNKSPVTIDEVAKMMKKMGIKVKLNLISGLADVEGLPDTYSYEQAPAVVPELIVDAFRQIRRKISLASVKSMLNVISDINRYNPVKDMLDSTQYDGIERIHVLDEILGITDRPQSQMLLRKWLHQTVAMALNDERKPYGADGVLTIQGDQGEGKTLFCAILAVFDDLFAEGVSIDTTNKDCIIQSTGVWIAELGELDSTLKREQSSLKAHITLRRDTYRAPYAPTYVKRPRRTSYCATVNPERFLNDDTGSRRFWVIHVDHIDTERLLSLDQDWLKQLWKQVHDTLFLPNPQGFRLTPEERRELLSNNQQYDKPLPYEIEIRDKLDYDRDIWGAYRVSDVIDRLELRGATAIQVGKVLAKLAKENPMITVKNIHGVKSYTLPII